MTVEEAKRILNNIIFKFSNDSIYANKKHNNDSYFVIKEVEHPSKKTFTEEEEFQIQELAKFIFEHEKSGNYASYLASEFIGHNKLDLALNYYELAIQYGYLPAYKFAGDLYYEGNLSSGKDLKKAFDYYVMATKTKKIGDGSWENPYTDVHNEAKMVLANMYKNGIYVEKDYEKYKDLINEVYKEVKDDDSDNEIKCDVFEEKANISLYENNLESSLNFLIDAACCCMDFYFQTFLIEQLYRLDELTNKTYEIMEIDINDIDFPDIFYLLKKPCKIKFTLNDKEHYIESLIEKGSIVINSENQWFRDAEEMVDRAVIDGEELKFNIINIEKWEVEEWKN